MLEILIQRTETGQRGFLVVPTADGEELYESPRTKEFTPCSPAALERAIAYAATFADFDRVGARELMERVLLHGTLGTTGFER